MRTVIFRTIAPYLSALMVLYSIFVLLRGHNEPGGGFIGGLIAASALAIFGIACGVAAVRRAIKVHPMSIRSEEHTSELQSLTNLVCRLLLEKKNNNKKTNR